jgi:hypothetical protein
MTPKIHTHQNDFEHDDMPFYNPITLKVVANATTKKNNNNR